MTASTTSTAYSGRVTNWPLIAVTLALGGGLSVLGEFWRGPWPGMLVPLTIVIIAMVAVLCTMSSIRVTTGANGVDVHFGVFGRPRFHYACDRIERVEIVAISFWSMGGWGIHWSPWRGWRLVLRSGPALRLMLYDGHTVTISVSDPRTALIALSAGHQG